MTCVYCGGSDNCHKLDCPSLASAYKRRDEIIARAQEATGTNGPHTKTCNYCGHQFYDADECPKCRDEFARAAPLMLQWSEPKHYPHDAELRYKWADAMLQARKVKP